MKLYKNVFLLFSSVVWLTDTYAMDPALIDNPRYQQLAYNPTYARSVKWSSYPPVLSASFISETDFSTRFINQKRQLSDHVGFETPLDNLQVRVWNILSPDAPSGYDYFAGKNEFKVRPSRIPTAPLRIDEQVALIGKWHAQQNAITLLQEVTKDVYDFLLQSLQIKDPLIQGDFEECTSGGFRVATFWNRGFVTATRIKANPTKPYSLSRSLMHKFTFLNLKNEVYIGNTHCAYSIWTANQAHNAIIIQNILDLAPLNATVFVGGDLNHSAVSLAPYLPSCQVCEFTNASLAFTPGSYNPGFRTNTTDGFFVRLAVPASASASTASQVVPSVVPAPPQSAASSSNSAASLWVENSSAPPPVIVSEETIKADLKPIASLRSFLSAPDGTLKVTMGPSLNLFDQLKSNPFPVTPNDFIVLSYKVKVEAGGTMTLGFLNSQGNGLYEPFRALSDGEYEETYDIKVPEGETQASLVVRHNHWDVSAQTTFTLSSPIVRYKKSAKTPIQLNKDAISGQLTTVYNYHAGNGVKQFATLTEDQKKQVLEQATSFVLNGTYSTPDTGPLMHARNKVVKEIFINQLTSVYDYHVGKGVKQFATLTEDQKKEVLEKAASLVLEETFSAPDTEPLIQAWEMILGKKWNQK